MARLATVIINGENGPVVINKSDFNPETMTLSETAAIGDVAVPAHAVTGESGPEAIMPVAGLTIPEPVTVAPGGDELRKDGPTVAEYVEAGYFAVNYPPTGYVSRSTPEEIAAAIETQKPKPAADPAPVAPAVPALMLVTKKGKKYVVVDAMAQPVTVAGIDPAGYPDEPAAWAAVAAVQAAPAS